MKEENVRFGTHMSGIGLELLGHAEKIPRLGRGIRRSPGAKVI